MPAFGADGILTPAQIDEVGRTTCCRCRARSTMRRRGRGRKPIFAENCAACHGEDGEGNRELGAPNLTDAIWLYGGDARRDRRPDHQARATA